MVTSTIFESSFESWDSTTIPEGFESNTGWLSSGDWEVISDDETNPHDAHSGSFAAFSSAAGAILTTDSIVFGENTQLSFWYKAELENRPMTLEVFIDDSTLIWSETFNNTDYVQATVDLSTYENEHVISFHSNTSDLYGQLLDDVVITSDFEEDDAPTNGGSDDDSGSPGGSPGGTSPPTDSSEENIPPVADLSKGEPYTGFTNGSIQFDGSLSYDSDGEIVRMNWIFGDGNVDVGEIVDHRYDEPGIYNVTLQVLDDDDANSSDTTTVHVQEGNYVPSKPQIRSSNSSQIDKNNVYILKSKENKASFLISSSDEDDDSLNFTIDWDDGIIETFNDVTSVLTVNHSWDLPGKYEVTVVAEDDISRSEESEAIVFINLGVIPITGEISGYIFGYPDDEDYSHFYNDELDVETELEKNDDNVFLIDSDGDNEWDYTYNETTGLSSYQNEKETSGTDDEKSDNETSETPGFAFSLLSVLLLFFVCVRKKFQ